MATSEDRSWAEGLDEKQFAQEYFKHYPHADSMPSLEVFLKSTPNKYHGIGRIDPSDYMEENVRNLNEDIKVEAPDMTPATCGCGKQYTHAHLKYYHLSRHQRKCPVFLSSRG